MSNEDWERVKSILHQAMQFAPDSRARFLDEACAADASLRDEVESMLAADAQIRPGFLQTTIREDELSAGAADLDSGRIFADRFRLVRKLGEGGMGQVWLADQTEPVRRQVAVKLIKAGMYDESVVKRFRSERQSLAIMDHPAIAKVFDAGATPQGQPYLVMEYVTGVPITEYCDQKKLTVQERLALLVQACEGVQHAHQKAIIHRDLKPANILVAEVDGKPVPRIIDFGLAKATVPQLTDETPGTRLGHFLGTPGYMSPEQVDPGAQDIDTRTDVYSLGVILYVLLTGSQPFEAKGRQRPPLDEWLRQLREEAPPTPSAKVNAERETSSGTAISRSTVTNQLVSSLRGDLDWITMKALEKERARRYATPSELAADLRHYLNHEPVLARPAGAVYQLRKYLRRHRAAAIVTGGLLMLLVAFSIVQSTQLRRITHERDRANRERDRATRITDFMTGMFKVSDPSQARGNTVTAREILDKASNDIATGLHQDPELQARLMYTMGSVYSELDLDSEALSLQERAVSYQRAAFGLQNAETLQSMTSLGKTLRFVGRYSEAEAINRETLENQIRLLGAEHPDTLDSMNNLANTLYYEGRYAEAEKLQRVALAIRHRVQGPENPATLAAMSDLGVSLRLLGQYAAAESLQREVLGIQRRVLGSDHPSTVKSIISLGNTFYNEGRSSDAESMYREALAIDRRIYGPEHSNTLNALSNLANVLNQEGQSVEAEKALRQALEIRRRTEGESHPSTLLVMENLSSAINDQGRHSEAESLQREVVALDQKVLGPRHPSTLRETYFLANTLVQEGRYTEAEKLALETIDAERQTQGAEHPDVIESMNVAGNAMRGEGRFADAEKMHRDALEIVRRIFKSASPEIVEVQSGLALDLSHEKRFDEAKPLFIQAVQAADRTQRRDVSSAAWYQFACGEALAGHRDEAVQDLRNAIDRGYQDIGNVSTDDDLKDLRRTPEFKQLVAELRSSAAGAKHQ